MRSPSPSPAKRRWGRVAHGMTLDDYMHTIGLHTGGAVRASLGIASNLRNVEASTSPLSSSTSPTHTRRRPPAHGLLTSPAPTRGRGAGVDAVQASLVRPSSRERDSRPRRARRSSPHARVRAVRRTLRVVAESPRSRSATRSPSPMTGWAAAPPLGVGVATGPHCLRPARRTVLLHLGTSVLVCHRAPGGATRKPHADGTDAWVRRHPGGHA
jgi:hypothetical protein